MRPVDVRNESWEKLRERVQGDRAVVWALLLRMPEPVTVRHLARELDADVLSVAPRVTELVQLGFARLAGKAGRRGLYVGIGLEEARRAFERMQGAPEQLSFSMGGR